MKLNKKKILLIDDDDDFCTLVKASVEKEGGELVRSEHPIAAIEVLKTHEHFDVIILDLNFNNNAEHPSVRNDRGEAILKLRQTNDKLIEIPVLVCSAENYAGTFMNIEAIGANDFLGKPMSFDSLIHKLELLVKKL